MMFTAVTIEKRHFNSIYVLYGRIDNKIDIDFSCMVSTLEPLKNRRKFENAASPVWGWKLGSRVLVWKERNRDVEETMKINTHNCLLIGSFMSHCILPLFIRLLSHVPSNFKLKPGCECLWTWYWTPNCLWWLCHQSYWKCCTHIHCVGDWQNCTVKRHRPYIYRPFI